MCAVRDAAVRRSVQGKPHHREEAAAADRRRHAGHGGEVQRSHHASQGEAPTVNHHRTRPLIWTRWEWITATVLVTSTPAFSLSDRLKSQSWLTITSAWSTSLLCWRYSGFLGRARQFLMGLCSVGLSSQDKLQKEVEKGKTVNLELVFGYHWKPGTGTSVRFLHVASCIALPLSTPSAFHFDHSSGKLSTFSSMTLVGR